MTIDEAKQYSLREHETIMKLLEGIVMPPGYRFNLVFAYLFLVLEHQKAIVVLVDSELHGSAFALLRLQVEAAFRGLWVGRVANDQQVEDIAKRGIEPFGNFKDMAKNVDEAYQANGKLKSIIEEGGWKTLNALTHSGLDQLVRRFSDDETFGPNYADDETKALLEFSGAVTSIMALFIFHANGFNEKFKALELWQKDNRKNVGQGLGNEAIDQ